MHGVAHLELLEIVELHLARDRVRARIRVRVRVRVRFRG